MSYAIFDKYSDQQAGQSQDSTKEVWEEAKRLKLVQYGYNEIITPFWLLHPNYEIREVKDV